MNKATTYLFIKKKKKHTHTHTKTLEWVAISFSNTWKWKVKVKSLSRVRLLATPWTAAYQAPPSLGFSRQEYWSGAPLPSPMNRLSYVKHFQKTISAWDTSFTELLLFSRSVVSDSSAPPWTVAHQAPLCMDFPRQKYWSGLPLPSPGDLPDPGIKRASPVLADRFFTTSATQEGLGLLWETNKSINVKF